MDTDIIAFINARLDEDEAAANAAVDFDYGVTEWCDDGDPTNVHIARHDPARVLREVAAKRAMVERYHDAVDTQGEYRADGSEYVAERMLRCVAAVWSDHPDYKQEWAL